MDNILLYLQVTLVAFLVNVIPAFVPPTWLVLSMYKVHNPALDSLWLAVFGVIGSVAGRFILYFCSKVLGKYLPHQYLDNATSLGGILGRKKRGLFSVSFIYALSPLPSNFLFITAGVSATEILPITAGFAIGRLIAYAILNHVSYTIFSIIESLGIGNMTLAIDILGVVGAVSVVFVDWKRILGKRSCTSSQ